MQCSLCIKNINVTRCVFPLVDENAKQGACCLQITQHETTRLDTNECFYLNCLYLCKFSMHYSKT